MQPSRPSFRSCSRSERNHEGFVGLTSSPKGATSMFNTIKTVLLAGAFATSAFVATSAQAASIIGLVDGKSIVTIDPKSRKVTQTVNIKGAATLLGIDVRAADGMIYAVASDARIATIDPKTAQATMKSRLSEMLKTGVV